MADAVAVIAEKAVMTGVGAMAAEVVMAAGMIGAMAEVSGVRVRIPTEVTMSERKV